MASTASFGLRTCRPATPGETDYKHCNDDVIRNCSAPCIGKIGRGTNTGSGSNRPASSSTAIPKCTWSRLETTMVKAAERQDFEKAARCRDMIDNLKKTLGPTRSFTRGRGVPTSAAQHQTARGRRRTRRRRSGLDVPPAGDGMLRYLQHLHDPLRRLDGTLQGWPTRQPELPPLPDQDRQGAGRLRQHGRGRAPPLLAHLARGAQGAG